MVAVLEEPVVVDDDLLEVCVDLFPVVLGVSLDLLHRFFDVFDVVFRDFHVPEKSGAGIVEVDYCDVVHE